MNVGQLGNRIVANVCVLLAVVCSPLPNALAEEPPAALAPINTHAEFDLSSTSLTMTALSAASTEIQVAETTLSVTPGTALTAAQYVAYQQVMNTGSQTLVLGTEGQAVGGSFNLGSVAAQPVSNLVVPGNVTAIHDAALLQSIIISGNLTNAGTIYALSSNPVVNSASFSAANIFNQSGALFTSILPAQGLPGFVSAVSNLNLNLYAAGDIINGGTISSAGNLSLTAGASIMNQAQAVMVATQNLNLTAATLNNAGLVSATVGSINMDVASIYNRGVIESIRGNIAVTNTTAPALGIEILSDHGGIISALLGEITTVTADSALKYNTTISGGTIRAEEILLSSGDGHLNLSIDDIQGALSVRAGTAHLAVNAGTNGMQIKELTITGDPDLIFTGTGPFRSPAFNSDGGVVQIDTSSDTVNGSITFTGAINTTPTAIAAGGNVTLTAGTTIVTQAITSSGNQRNAGNISLQAPLGMSIGAITATSDNCFLCLPVPTSTVTLTSASGPVVAGTINTAAAVGSVGVSGGRVAIAGSSVIVQDIDTNGLSSGGGQVYIFSQGNLTASSILTSSNVGADIILSAGNSGAGNLVTGNLSSQSFAGAIAGSIILTSTGNLTTSAVLASGRATAGGLGGQVVAVAGKGGSPASLNMGSINTEAGSFPGQVVIVNMGDGGSVTTGSITTRAQAVGNGADASITAHGVITTGAILTQAVGVGFGGDVWLSSGATSGTGITTASITRSGLSGSGQIYALINPTVATSLGVVTPALTAADFVGTPSSPQASITGDVTLSVTSGAVSGFNPGGFTSINAPSGIITLNQPIRVPAPIVSRTGALTIGSIAGALPQAQTLTLVAPGTISVSSLPAIQTGVFRAISTNGAITLPSIDMSGGASPGGAIGVVASQGITVPAISTLSTNGLPAGPIGLISPGGSINVAGALSAIPGGRATLVALSFLNVTGTVTAGSQTSLQLAVVPTTLPATPAVTVVATLLPTTAGTSDSSRTMSFADLPLLPSVLNLGIPTDRINFDLQGLVSYENDLQPVAHTSPSFLFPENVKTLQTDALVTKFLPGAQVVVSEEAVKVIHGEALVQAKREITVNASGHEVTLRPGTVVIVSVDSGTVKIYNVWERRSKSAKVSTGSQTVCLGVGDEMIIGADNERIVKVISGDGIGRRNVRWFQTNSEKDASLAEFSMLGLFQTSKILSRLLQSSSRDDRWLANNALKMTACLMHVTKDHGIYRNGALGSPKPSAQWTEK